MADNVDNDSGVFPGVSDKDEAYANDSCRFSGVDTTILLTTTAVELKVGGSVLADRKYIFLQARDNNIRWGFNTSCNFDIFKNQFIIMPLGVTIYAKTTTGTGTIVIGEAS